MNRRLLKRFTLAAAALVFPFCVGVLLDCMNDSGPESPMPPAASKASVLKPVHATTAQISEAAALREGQQIAARVGEWRRSSRSRASTPSHEDVNTPLSRRDEAVRDLHDRLGPGVVLRTEPASQTLRSLQGDLSDLVKTSSGYLQARARGDSVAMALALLQELRDVLRIENPTEEFTPERTAIDELGMTHVRLQQVCLGAPVWGAEIAVHFDANARPVEVSGVYAPTPAGLDPRVAVSETEALAAARQALSIAHSSEEDAVPPAVRKAVYWQPGVPPVLCWSVDLAPDASQAKEVFVSAADGAVVHVYDKVRADAETGQAPDLMGRLQEMPCWADRGLYYAINTTLPMYNPVTSKPPNILKLRGAMYLLDFANQDPSKSFSMKDVTTPNANAWDPTAVSLMRNLLRAEEYYRTTFRLHSIDNAGMNIWAAIHWRWKEGGGSSGDNACWNPTVRCMQFGDGERIAGGLLPHALDIVAHEYCHGVTSFAANLIYENQSGALDEALADFFACMVDREDWLIGEDFAELSGKKSLRDLSHPQSPDTMYRCPAKMEDYLNKPVSDDHGGVHFNMGIGSHAGYLLAEGLNGGITKEKTEQIFHRARLFYLTQRSQFADFRRACLTAAKDLYGEGGAEWNAVQAAFDAVGIVEEPEARISTPGVAVEGEDRILYLQADESAGWDEYHDGYFCRLYQRLPDGRQVLVTPRIVSNALPAVSGDGQWIVYIGQDQNLYGTDGLQEQALTQNGIVRSVALSKDRRTLAYATVNFDNKIYLVDTQTGLVTAADLTVPVKDATPFDLKYADVLSFNFRGDHIVFDAVSEMRLADNRSLLSWGIYGMRRVDRWIFPVKAQAADEQIGNPVLSNLSDHRLVADRVAYEEGGKYHLELVAIDFDSGWTDTLFSGLSRFGQASFNGDDTRVFFRDVDKVQQKFFIYQGSLSEDRRRLTGTPEAVITDTVEVIHPYGFRVGTYAPQAGRLSADPSVAFGAMMERQILKRPVTLTNQGNADLQILGITFRGEHPDWFTHTAANSTLPPGGTLTFTVACQPQGGGLFNTGLAIQSTDPSRQEFLIDLGGEARSTGTPTPTVPAEATPTATPTLTPTATPSPSLPPVSVVYEFDRDSLALCGWAEIPGGFSSRPGGMLTTGPQPDAISSSQDRRGLSLTVQPGEVAFAYAQTPIETHGAPLLLRLVLRADTPNAAVTLAVLKNGLAQADGSIATDTQQSLSEFVEQEGSLVLLYQPDGKEPLTPVIQAASTDPTTPVTVRVDRLEALILDPSRNYGGAVFHTARPLPAPAPSSVAYEFAEPRFEDSGWQTIPGGFAGAAPGDIEATALPQDGFPSSGDQRGWAIRVEPGQVAFACLATGRNTQGHPALLRLTLRADRPNATVALAALQGDLFHADGSVGTLMPQSTASFTDGKSRLCLLYQPSRGETICPIIQVAATGSSEPVTVWVDRLEVLCLDSSGSWSGREFFNRLPDNEPAASITIPLAGMDVTARPLQMVHIAAGSFRMGSPETEQGRGPEEWPPHEVQVSRPFYIGRFEVTQAHWAAVMGASTPEIPLDLQNEKNNPVLNLTWFEAVRFCNQLSQLQGLRPAYDEATGAVDPQANGFRLPTEEEWEYACRAGTLTRFFWGEDPDGSQSLLYARFGSSEEVGIGFPRLANALGLWDMSGNAREWCQDWYATPQASYAGPWRSARGGSFLDGLERCRSASRQGQDPDQRYLDTGFRVIRSVP